ncbi:MAG: hypothetical protein QOF02_1650 [Blastocatellia bacterium]|jgi:hypothetical protein|nr:hypothetical protein [Blastocatellia bacterium]
MSYPKADAELVIWYKNFSQKFATHAPTLGFTAADVSAVQADAAMLDYLIGDLLPTYQSALQARTAYKNVIKDGPIGVAGGNPPGAPVTGAAPATVEPGIVPRLRRLIQRIKSAPNYTQAVGEDLDLIGPEKNAPGDDITAKPVPKAFALPGSHVQIEFNKGGFDGVSIEGRREGETAWTPLGIDLYSPFIDTRPPAQNGMPEVREYRLRYLLRDEATGQWSDIVSVTTMP